MQSYMPGSRCRSVSCLIMSHARWPLPEYLCIAAAGGYKAAFHEHKSCRSIFTLPMLAAACRCVISHALPGCFIRVRHLCHFHSSLHQHLPLHMADYVPEIMPFNRRCHITEEYSLRIGDVSRAYKYASCRLLAMHRAINKDGVGSLPQYPAAFYKNMCWEVDVSPQSDHSLQFIDLLARPSSLLGSFNSFVQSTSDITMKLSTSLSTI